MSTNDNSAQLIRQEFFFQSSKYSTKYAYITFEFPRTAAQDDMNAWQYKGCDCKGVDISSPGEADFAFFQELADEIVRLKERVMSGGYQV